MKISIIGAGNVGSLAAMRIAQDRLGQVVLVDIVKGLAQGKSLDMDDARLFFSADYSIEGTDDIAKIKDSDIVVMTAGLARKPGMTREDLLAKNAQIVKDTCLKIKELAPEAILIIVTNPLDIMAYLAFKITGFKRNKVVGMGLSLDAARFANLIAKDLSVSLSEIEPLVIGSHGEGMLPLPRLTTVKGKSLLSVVGKEKADEFVKRTIGRGAEIVSHLGNGSAYFAPSAAIADLVKAIVSKDNQLRCACVYLEGEYGLKDIFLGVPCRLGKNGIEEIIQLELNDSEKQLFSIAANSLKAQYKYVQI
mgnify:FL=1